MDENNKNDRLIDVENEMIGKFLSMEVNNRKPDTACPSDEHLAAFMDGNLNDADKDALMGHVSSCDECYDLFTEVISIQEEPAKDSWLDTKVIVFKFVAYSLAAAAVILIMFFVFRDNSINKLS
ncbi:MAG: zf-HC2 domain-containing protein, partial [Candidatus Scalindua sp.]